MFQCSNCGLAHPSETQQWRCPRCRTLWDLAKPVRYLPPDPNEPGIWQYRASMGLPTTWQAVSRGEGHTPLQSLQLSSDAGPVWLKREDQNPSGSHQARVFSVLLAYARAAGAKQLLGVSTGNAALALADYAAPYHLPIQIYLPNFANLDKLAAINNPDVRLIDTGRVLSETETLAQQAAERGDGLLLSQVANPLAIAALSTIAFEIVEQLGQVPGTVVCPVGHGILLLGLYRGFVALQQAGVITSLPKLVGLQAEGCAPLWAVLRYGIASLDWVSESASLSDGLRVIAPARGDAVLAAIRESHGTILVCDEMQIEAGRVVLARQGLAVESTAAILWHGLRLLQEHHFAQPVVGILTGAA